MTTTNTTAADRYEAISLVLARRKRAWMVQPEANVRAFRFGLARAYRLALKRGEIWAQGDRKCACHA